MTSEERIGVVTNYAPRPQAAIIEIEAGHVRIGDTIRIKGPNVDLFERVASIHFERQPVEEAIEGQRVGIRVSQDVPRKAEVFLVRGDIEQEEAETAQLEDEDEEVVAARLALKRRELRREVEEGRSEAKRISKKDPDRKLAREMHDFWG